jgi:threonine dehydrogenase-like Zn-dependent dehydrogenase
MWRMEILKKVMSVTNNPGVDTAFESAGINNAVNICIDLTREVGRIELN